MKRILIIFTFLLNVFLVKCQIPDELGFSCGMANDIKMEVLKNLNSDCSSIYLTDRNYDVPFIPSNNYLNYSINVNFIFLQREDGSGNFQENNTEDQALINDVIAAMNSTFDYLIDPHDPNCYSGSDFIANTKIIFDVNKIYIRDNYGWNNQNKDVCPESPWYLDYLDDQIVADSSIRRGINVYFTEDSTKYMDLVVNQTTQTYTAPGVSCSQYPSFIDFSRTSKVHITDKYSKYWYMKNICPSIYNLPWDPDIRNWYLSTGKGIAHELGHSLWLFHYCPYYNTNQCYYSIMNQSGNSPRNYLPPSEIGRIHASMSLSNIRTFINEEYYNAIPFDISTSYIWNSDIRLYQDLIINSGGNLIVSCKLSMPSQSEIRVKSNGKLFLDNNIITSISSNWNGITVENGGYLSIKNLEIHDCSITIKSGGTLQISEDFLISNNNCITIESGAYICIDPEINLTLSDYNSVINLLPNYIIGVNPSLGIFPDCIVDPTLLSWDGPGSINTFSQDTYVQNETISNNRYITGNNIFVGRSVTTLKPEGDVIISNGVKVVFKALQYVNFEGGFEVQLGGELETK